MNTLQALRQEAASALSSTGLRVVDHLPESITPPVALLAAGSPYVEGGDTFGSFAVRLTVVLVCSQGGNAVATRELDDAVTAAVVALDGSSWGIERVDQPTMLQQNGANYLSTTVEIVRRHTGMDDGRA